MRISFSLQTLVMESKHNRKLLQLYQACSGDRELVTAVQNATSPPMTPPPQPPSPLDSSMALTIFILLIALFFMGFFSIYIRHFADDSTAEMASMHRRRVSTMSPRHSSTSVVVSRPFSSWRGLDSQVNLSLRFSLSVLTINPQDWNISGRSISASAPLHESQEAED